MRIGVMRKQVGDRADVAAMFGAALADLKRAGAVLVEIEFEPDSAMFRDSFQVLMFELREEMGKYLASLPGEGLPRSLADLIAFNRANADRELRWFGQGLFEQAEAMTVPMGAVERLPVGLSFIGAKWADRAVLEAGAAYERVRTAALAEPSFERWTPAD